MTCAALSYAERDIVGRGLLITTMVVTVLCIRYSAIWRLGMGLRYGEVCVLRDYFLSAKFGISRKDIILVVIKKIGPA